MHISTQSPRALPYRPAAKAAVQSQPEVSSDPVDVGPAALYSHSASAPKALPDSPPPALQRPVIFLHGFNGHPEGWDSFKQWMSSRDDHANKDGGTLDAGHFDQIDPKANLFSLRLSRPYNAVEKNKDELREAIDAVCKATGSPEVDLVVHSLGGLDTRAYFQDGDEKVKKFVMLGTPNHGSALANLELFFREKFDYPVIPPVDDPDVRRVLHQLSVDKLDKNKEPKNPWLRNLNDNWTGQRRAADTLLIAGSGIPTATGGPGITAFGDGVVARKSAKLDGIEQKTAWFKNHSALLTSPKVMETTAKWLVGRPLDDGENLFDNSRDAIRAAQLLNPVKPPSGPIEKASIQETKRAAKLPLLDPAFQMGMALGVLSAMMGGPREHLPMVEIALSSSSLDSDVQGNYNVDLAREGGNQVQGSGVVDGQPFAEVADFQQGKMYWKSAVGLQSSNLEIAVGDDEKSITMKGELGGVPTDLTLNLLTNDKENISGLETTGLFNGENYYLKSTIDMGSLLNGSSHDGIMTVNGMVNGEPTERNYAVDVSKGPQGIEFNAHKEAKSANEEAIGVSVKVIEQSEG